MEVFVSSKTNKQQLTILFDVAVNGIASYFNAMQDAGARGGIDGHGQTRADTYGCRGRQWEGGEGGGGVECRFIRPWCCFRCPIVDVYVHVLANPGTTHGNTHRITRGRARRDEPCAHSR